MRYFKDDKDGYYQADEMQSNWTEISEQDYLAQNPPVTTLIFEPLSAWQVRKVLNKFNLRTQVEQAISQAPQEVKDAWAYANEFNRDSATLIGMAQALGISDTQLDMMFAEGATL